MKRFALVVAVLALSACTTQPSTRSDLRSVVFSTGEEPGDTALFGVVLGKPIAMPECELEPRDLSVVGALNLLPRRYAMRHLREPRQACYTRIEPKLVGSSQPLGTEPIVVNYPPAELPRFLFEKRLRLALIDGKVESAGFYTHGHVVQRETLDALATKFGPPSRQRVETWQNDFGARIEILVAGWDRPRGTTIDFRGDGDGAHGHVIARTAAGNQALRRQGERAREAQRPL